MLADLFVFDGTDVATSENIWSEFEAIYTNMESKSTRTLNLDLIWMNRPYKRLFKQIGDIYLSLANIDLSKQRIFFINFLENTRVRLS